MIAFLSSKMRVCTKERSTLGRHIWQRGGGDEADGGGRVNQREEEDGRRRHDSIRSSSVGSAKSFSHRSLAQRRAIARERWQRYLATFAPKAIFERAGLTGEWFGDGGRPSPASCRLQKSPGC